jgi:hypothetical protein
LLFCGSFLFAAKKKCGAAEWITENNRHNHELNCPIERANVDFSGSVWGAILRAAGRASRAAWRRSHPIKSFRLDPTKIGKLKIEAGQSTALADHPWGLIHNITIHRLQINSAHVSERRRDNDCIFRQSKQCKNIHTDVGNSKSRDELIFPRVVVSHKGW